MKTIIAAAAAAGLAAVALLTAPAAQAEESAAPECNWGQLTAAAIAGGFEQGPHASSFAGTKRSGLANVVEQGNLAATCALLSGPVQPDKTLEELCTEIATAETQYADAGGTVSCTGVDNLGRVAHNEVFDEWFDICTSQGAGYDGDSTFTIINNDPFVTVSGFFCFAP